ncbi:UDP-N-acetylmuramoyl-L-alanyl-D-glutamate--2, 6-diaminopimelate ligase [Campylobacter majalis]|uniref:UDP-N-acetylmuramoyl-L-alanyl-D-glutamate--2,6-diaminopimelate ligase n=1 Tax=Campylobacter majalis TaxID=2790656 RepID=A0ABM8Q4B7_9BACT|nr:UDP-N-acetylmuramoyl-L-alanyl-D-glutamate--2,6-diaminopimelate ligase [Campylobacter majalis]CAD7287626.1 UDP-N-acetylmuramoyl-L-alanyl-D-glutamate--2, 6-diaminopimelate ligase [Campylobacter majalis]
MKIAINNTFVTDNTSECESGCYFLQTKSNAKYKAPNNVHLINVHECKKLLNINENIKLIGITGTNGKTTTAAAIYETLLALGYKAGVCGTRGAFVNHKKIDAKSLTTSQILKTLEYLKIASEQECEYFIMEVSSHAIAQDRIEGLNFDLKIFTNLSQDHLDYHKSMQEYANVKNSFLSDDSAKIINIDDKYVKFNHTNAITYALKNNAIIKANEISLNSGIQATLEVLGESVKFNSSLQGEFNLYNLMAAFGAVKILTNQNAQQISNALAKFNGVEGRMQVVSQNPLVIVDFAHTPDGMEKVLNALRHLNLVVVFGAGGDRDKTKRPLMGQIAQKYARVCVVTSDNPRSEEPMSIIDEILSGMDKTNTIANPDRKEAIKIGLNKLKPNEALVILGKGDEDYQEINGIKYPFSDEKVVLELLN